MDCISLSNDQSSNPKVSNSGTLFSPKPLFDTHFDVPIAIRNSVRSFKKHRLSNVVSYRRLNPNFKAFTTSLSFEYIPKKCTRAPKELKWKEAIFVEMRALHINDTGEVVELP